MNKVSEKIQPKQVRQKLLGKKKPAELGYGMMLLILFITSTVLIGTSVQMLLGNSSAAYLGTYSQDAAAATALAQSGLEAVQLDIQSKLNAGTSVSTAYTYSSTNITMPTDPSSLGGGTTTIGSYSATMTAARGNTYLVQVTATVNAAVETYSKLLTISRTGNLVDVLTGGGANAAYSVRKLRSSYSGSALRVRRSSDNAEQDIGFDGNGNLDVASLQTFLSTDTLPLDSVGSAAAAFGMRKLRAAYTGYCLKVRRSSDNATQDIGFTATGDLDVSALLSFVGTGTGYVSIWYDQSGNGNNAVQAGTTYQPIIVTSGVLNTLNNRPIMTFDGVDDAMDLTNTVYNDITIMAVYNTIAGYGAPGTVVYNENMLISADQAFTNNDYAIGVDTSGNVNGFVGNPDTNSGSYAASPGTPGDNLLHWMTFTRKQSTAIYSVYTESGSYSDTNGNTASLNAHSAIHIGFGCGGGCHGNNSFSEVLAYTSVLSDSNRLLLERNEGWYYNMYPLYQSVTGPLDVQGSATLAFGLRKLRSAYAGYAIRVRRSSDNTTRDIGFDTFGNLDVGSLMSFVGSGSGYVNIWYDQSGNSRNGTQSSNSNQPRIVNAGVLETQNGKPTVRFIRANSTCTDLATELSGITNYTAMAVIQAVNSADDNYLMTGASQNRQLLRLNNGTLEFFGGAVTPVSTVIPQTDTQLNAIAIARNSATGVGTGYVNGMLRSMTGTDAGSMYLQSIGHLGGFWADMYMSELILYPSVTAPSASTLISLQQNEMDYYAPPLPPAYVTIWYDQSGNGNDAVQTNPMLQPTLIIPPYGSNISYPTVMFNGGQYLASTTGHPTSSDYSKAAVFSYFNNSAGSNNIISSIGASGRGALLIDSGSTYIHLYHNGSNFATNTWALSFKQPYSIIATYVESSKTGTIYALNTSVGSSASSSSATTTPISLGAANYINNLYGSISEAIVFPRVLSATERTAIYADEQNYFSSQ